jgi:hypothetical protein
VLLDDQWLYRWRGTPPRDFCLYKTLFRPRTPAEIVSNGWSVLHPAVKEIANACGIASVSAYVDWLQLDNVYDRHCLAGVYGDEIVTAATVVRNTRKPFIPLRFYEILRKHSEWKNQSYASAYRYFEAHFDTGLSFYSDAHQLTCEVSYAACFNVHGVNILRALIHVDGVTVITPWSVKISASLQDMPGRIEWLNTKSQEFIGRLGSRWLYERGADEIYNLIVRTLAPLKLPKVSFADLRNDRRLSRCLTRLDILLFIVKTFDITADKDVSTLFKISNILLT